MRKLAKLFAALLMATVPCVAQTQHDRIKSRGASTFDQFSNTAALSMTGTTPSVAGGNVFKTNNSSSTTVTNFLNGVDTQTITVICGDTNTIIQNNSNIAVAGGVNFSCTLNTGIQFVFNLASGVWSQVGGSGSGGGGSPGAPAQSFQCNNGSGGFVACNVTDDTVNVNVNENVKFKGPNPYVDITAFGARACNVNITPCATGLTANTTVNSTSVTVSSASTFVNGDGVVIYGAGAAVTMSTPGAPTVIPSLAQAGTGTGLVVNAPAGTTTYNYKLIARDVNGGLTAASSIGSTSTGSASLGNQQVNITSCSRSNATVTCLTASAHNLAVGAEIKIGAGNSLSDGSFYGRWVVNTVPDNTHFTFISGVDTRNGGSAASTGGVLIYFNANHLTWSSVASAWEYWVCSDRANPGTYAVIGRSMPQGTNTDLTFDDFGSPMMDNQVFPPYITSSICGAASSTNDMLATTISSGAGTTSLTLANTAGATVSGATIRLDSGSAILAAATAANANGSSLYVPVDPNSGSFPVSSFVDLRSLNGVNVMQTGNLWANETIATKAKWYCDRQGAGNNSTGPGQWQGAPVISVNSAHPAIYNSAQFGTVLQGCAISNSGTVNGILGSLYEGGFNMQFIGDSFTTGTGNNDYMGIGLYLRGSAGQSATNVILDTTNFAPGGPVSDSGSQTPAFFCKFCGQGQIRSAYFVHRGGQLHGVAAGGTWKIDHSYINGGSTPLYRFSGYANDWTALVSVITLDTVAEPCIVAQSVGTVVFTQGACASSSPNANITGAGVTGVSIPILGSTTLVGGAFPNINSGASLVEGNAQDGVFNSSTGGTYSTFQANSAVATGKSYPIFVNGAAPAQPTCAVSSGGSVPTGTYQFEIIPLWQNGGEGVPSPVSAACTTTTGNQTITVTYSGVSGNPKGLDLYYCVSNGTTCSGGPAAGNTFSNPQSPTSTSFVWSSFSFNAAVAGGSVPAGGPTMLMPGTQGITAPQYVLPNSGFSSTELAGTLTANRTVTKPDVTGFGIVTPELFTNSPRGPLNILFPGALTTTWTGETFTPDKAITVTRLQVQLKTAPSSCSTNAVVRLTDGTNAVNVTVSSAANDSGSITQNYAAGVALILSVQTAASGCTVSPGDANVTIQYKMQ